VADVGDRKSLCRSATASGASLGLLTAGDGRGQTPRRARATMAPADGGAAAVAAAAAAAPAPSLAALNEDALYELFARCPPETLLALRGCCRAFARLLSGEAAWARRLADDLGLRARAAPAAPAALFALARSAYAAPPAPRVRFQAVFVGGGVDLAADGAPNMSYWADNLFGWSPRSPYCSNASANCDVLALLLDEEVPAERRYAAVRALMRERVRYALALMNNFALTAAGMRAADAVLDGWSDQTLEHFFLLLVAQLQGGEPWGSLLLATVPAAGAPAERERVLAAAAYLRRRHAAAVEVLARPPGAPADGNALLDAEVLQKVADPARRRRVAVVRELTLSRAGSLTCPVAAGAVLAGVVDYERLAALAPAEAAAALEAAARDAAAAGFDSLLSRDDVAAAAGAGAVPAAGLDARCAAGEWVDFTPAAPGGGGGASAGGGRRPLITWTPLVWFRFSTAQELAERAPVEEAAAAPPAAHGGGAVELVPAAEPAGAAAAAAAEPGDADSLDGAYDAAYDAAYAAGPGSEAGGEEELEMVDALEEAAASDDEEAGEEDEEPDEEMQAVMEGLAEEDDEEEAEEEDHTAGRNLLRVALARPVAANCLLVKLISQENLMHLMRDEHGWPNIDMSEVGVAGKVFELPPGAELAL
jgi:hypothetical protein